MGYWARYLLQTCIYRVIFLLSFLLKIFMNPFVHIVPREDEDLVNESFIKEVAESIKRTIKDKRLIILVGEPGLGKSHYLKRIYDRLRTKKDFLFFNETLAKKLQNYVKVKNKSIFIDNLDLSKGLNDERFFELTEEFKNILDAGMIIITAATKETVKRLLKINPLLRPKTKRIKIPRLTYEEAMDLIIKRLNEARKTKSDDVSPFTKKELKKIISKCNGNPRMILMLLGPLYEMRMLEL